MKKLVRVVGALIYDSGLIFCTQRGNEKSLANKWEFPGGKIEINESPEEALVREIKEELSSDIHVEEKFDEVEHEYEDFIIQLEVFKSKLIKGDLLLSEHINSVWADKEILGNLDFAEADLPIVKKLLEVNWIK